jgi:Na+-driven multidrug efflux pump
MFFIMGISFYTSRVILNILGVEDFGLYGVIGGVVALFNFLTSTLSAGTQRFLTFHLGKNNRDALKTTFSSALSIYICLVLIILVLAETVGLWFVTTKISIPHNRIDAARWVYQFSVFSSLILIIQAPFNASILSHERMNIYA